MDRQSGRAYGFGLNRDGHIAFAAAYIAVLATVSAYGFYRTAQQLPALRFPSFGQQNHLQPVAFREHPVPDPAFPHISRYPRIALLKHQEGTVVLNLLVLQDGEVGDVRLLRSSGSPQLDAAAQVEAGNWRYLPAVRNGAPVSAQVNVAIRFRIAARGT
jgi:TonB family protein